MPTQPPPPDERLLQLVRAICNRAHDLEEEVTICVVEIEQHNFDAPTPKRIVEIFHLMSTFVAHHAHLHTIQHESVVFAIKQRELEQREPHLANATVAIVC